MSETFSGYNTGFYQPGIVCDVTIPPVAWYMITKPLRRPSMNQDERINALENKVIELQQRIQQLEQTVREMPALYRRQGVPTVVGGRE